jgi:hypothetical protein
MRTIPALLLILAGAGCGPPVATGSSYGDKCSPAGTATLDSIAIGDESTQMPVKVGDRWFPSSGGQGLPMAQFRILLFGTVPDCTEVHATAQNGTLEGAQNVLPTDTGGQVDVRIGPVDDSFAIDAVVAGQTAHVDITNNFVSAVR